MSPSCPDDGLNCRDRFRCCQVATPTPRETSVPQVGRLRLFCRRFRVFPLCPAMTPEARRCHGLRRSVPDAQASDSPLLTHLPRRGKGSPTRAVPRWRAVDMLATPHDSPSRVPAHPPVALCNALIWHRSQSGPAVARYVCGRSLLCGLLLRGRARDQPREAVGHPYESPRGHPPVGLSLNVSTPHARRSR